MEVPEEALLQVFKKYTKKTFLGNCLKIAGALAIQCAHHITAVHSTAEEERGGHCLDLEGKCSVCIPSPTGSGTLQSLLKCLANLFICKKTKYIYYVHTILSIPIAAYLTYAWDPFPINTPRTAAYGCSTEDLVLELFYLRALFPGIYLVLTSKG